MSIFNTYVEFSNYLMDHTLKDLSQLILKVGLFPTQEVLECTAKYLELHMQICLRVVKRGYTSFIRQIEYILASGRRQFFLSNNSKCDPYHYPFGDKLASSFDLYAWVAGLKPGDLIDAAKFCKHETRAIWSRAKVVEADNYKVYVKFLNENNKVYQNKSLSISPFMLAPYKSRSLDFEWRENLEKGDHIDIYLGRKGWLYFEVTEVLIIENPESGEKVKKVSCAPDGYGDDIYSSEEEKDQYGNPRLQEITVEVHDPLVRKPRKFSDKRYVSMEYAFDEIYEIGNDDMFAVFRGRFETNQSRKENYLNSKFFIRFVNLFCMEGGLDLLKDRLTIGVEASTAEFVGFYMSIMEAITPYLLNRTIDQYGQDILVRSKNFILNSPLDILKTFSSDMIKSVYTGYTILAKRLYSSDQAAAQYETFFLELAINCVKTDFLERKINGVTFLGDIYKNIKNKDFKEVDKKQLVKAIEDGSLRFTRKYHGTDHKRTSFSDCQVLRTDETHVRGQQDE